VSIVDSTVANAVLLATRRGASKTDICFISSLPKLPVKRGGSLSFLVGTIGNVLVMEIRWTDVGSGGYILVSCAHSNKNPIFRHIKSNNSGTATVKIVKNEGDPPLFTGKLVVR
jgi:hypothetical protein